MPRIGRAVAAPEWPLPLDAASARSYLRSTPAKACAARLHQKGVIMAAADSVTTKVTDQSFDQDVLKSSEPVVVDFWAEWCGPCRMIAPALEDIAKEMQGKVKVAKFNIDENPGIPGKLGIQSIPTLLLFKDGQVAAKMVGAKPKGELQRWITGAI